MTIPDRKSIEVAKKILADLLPNSTMRTKVSKELANFWLYAKRNYPEKSFITLSNRYIRMNVGMVEVFVIYNNDTLLLVVDKTMVDPDAEQIYMSLPDALPKYIPLEEFDKIVPNLRQAVFSVVLRGISWKDGVRKVL
jgi:hypothetical protein